MQAVWYYSLYQYAQKQLEQILQAMEVMMTVKNVPQAVGGQPFPPVATLPFAMLPYMANPDQRPN